MEPPTRPQLNSVSLADISRPDLLDLAAEECRLSIPATDALVWMLDPKHSILVNEAPDLAPKVLTVTARDVKALFSTAAGDGRLTAPSSGVVDRLVEASFGPDSDDRGRCAVIPLRIDRRQVGAVVFRTATGKPDAVSGPGEVAAALNHVAVTLMNHDALRRTHQLEALLQTTTEISSNLQLDTVLKTIVERARIVMNAPISYIMLHDPDRSAIDMSAVSGVASKDFKRISLQTGAGLGGMTLQQRRPFYTTDYLNDDRYRHESFVDREVRKAGIRSIVGVPVFTRKEFVAVLYVADRVLRVFPVSDVDVLANLGQHVGLAIENARLYERDTQALGEIQRINALVNSQNVRLTRADQAQRRLAETMLSGGGFAEIAECASALVGRPIVVLDHHHKPIAAAGGNADSFGAKLAAEGLPASGRNREVDKVLRAVAIGEPQLLTPAGQSRQAARLVVPIVARSEILGSVWVEVDDDTTDEARTIAEQSARVVALELLHEQSVAEVERRIHRELLDDLLAERPPPWDLMMRRAANSGIPLSDDLRICIVGPRGPNAGGEDTADLTSDPDDGLQGAALITSHSGYQVALLSDWDDRTQDRLEAALARRRPPGQAVVCKLSRTPGTNHANFDAARKLLELLDGGETQRILDLDESRVLALLFGTGDLNTIRTFVDGVLGALGDADPNGRLDLLNTLEAYLFSGASPSATAHALHVHVNTVYYRLERIKKVLGADFARPRRALDLQIACLAKRLL